MVVVVAAVDPVSNVSFTKSGLIWRCAYRCAEQKITRGGSWDGLPDVPACPLIIPKLSSPRSPLSTMFSPLVCRHIPMPLQRHSARLKIVRRPVIKDDHRVPVPEDRLGACDQKRSGEIQRPEACCLIRFVSSVTWLNTLRRSAMRVRIFRSACITVVWSRPPNCCPIFGSDKSVSSRHRYIAI
jgi:hypothetical protein